jgi:hypothetical protein
MGRARQIGRIAAKASTPTLSVPKWAPDCPYKVPEGKSMVVKLTLREKQPVEIIATCEKEDDARHRASRFQDHAHYAVVYGDDHKPVVCYLTGRQIQM